MPKLETIFNDAEQISPGGRAAIGLKADGLVVAWCIGSGDNFRDAKASALRHVREILRQVKQMKPPGPA
jgi:hypothetical protein